MKKNRLFDYLARVGWKKWIQTMKLTAFLILFFVVDASASFSQSTKISVKVENGTLSEIFSKIETQSEYRFFYQNEQIRDVGIKSVDATNKNILDVVNELLKETELSCKLVDRNIIIFPKSENPMDNLIQQKKSISGKITDSSGAFLPGVSVVVKGTTTGVITDSDGKYLLPDVSSNATLLFSFVGMKMQEVIVGSKSVINIVMIEEPIGIDEIVAIGYGTQKKLNLTGSISQIKSDELTEIPMPTLAQSAMGKASGVFIKNVNGQPGDDSGVQINIRGFGTPLLIVDGMPVSETVFQQLDPNDIEDFNILKDASAAAVYGARAGNGVILVKTKRGSISKPEFTYNGNYSLQFITIRPDFVSSAQYAEMENAARYNEGLAPIWTAEEIQKFRDGSDPVHYPNTDWWDATLRQFAHSSSNTISMSGEEPIKSNILSPGDIINRKLY